MCTYSDDSREPAHRRALCLTHMLSHYVQLHACLFGSMRALLHAIWYDLFLSEPPSTCTVRSDTTIDPMCVRAANALMRQYICPGSSELSMLAYKQTSLSY